MTGIELALTFGAGAWALGALLQWEFPEELCAPVWSAPAQLRLYGHHDVYGIKKSGFLKVEKCTVLR